MKKINASETVKKLIGIQSWIELTSKKKIKQYLTLYSFLEKKVNEEIITNIPKFNTTFNALLSELKERMKEWKKLKHEQDSELLTIIENLKTTLSKEELSFEERKLVIEDMNYVINKMSQIKRNKEERKRKMIKGATLVGTVFALVTSQFTKKNNRN